MGVPPILAKVTIPEITGDYPRERLFKALDEARAGPMIWVSGPGGAGKTHLLASYIRNYGLDAVWYHVDHGDTDAASFFYYLGIAARRFTSGLDEVPSSINQDHVGDLSRFAFRFFEELFQLMPDDSLLVLDNIQEIHENAPLYGIILDAVTRIPKQVTLVIISRNDPPASMSHLLAARKMAVFDWSQVAFTLEEFSQTARVLGDAEFSAPDMESLHRELEGWVAGLVLTLEQVRRSGRMPQKLPEGTSHDIIDFFAGQIWNVLDAGTREFLMKTSCLPYMTGDMARELTGHTYAEARLVHLSDYNFFTLRFEPGPRYRYHNLFREYLTQQLRDSMSYGEIRWLKQNAAALLFQEGYPEDSAELLIEEKDWEGLNSLLRQAAPDLYGQGRFKTIQGWIQRTPETVRHGYPWFLYWEGSCKPFLDSEGRLFLFSKALEIFEKEGDREGQMLAWAGKVVTYLHRQRSLNELDELVDQFSALEPFFRTTKDPYIRHQVSTSMFLALTFRQPNHPEALKWEGLARENIELNLDPNSRAAFSLASVLRWYFRGNVTMFGNALREFLDSLDDLDSLLPQHRAMFHALRSTQSWLQFDLDECLAHAREGLKFSEDVGGTIWDGLLLGQEINTCLSRGDLSEARKCLELYRSFTDRLPPLSVSYYHQRMAWYCLARGDHDEAIYSAGEGVRYAVEAGIPNNLGYALIVKAEVHLALEETGWTKEHLADAYRVARELGNPLMELTCGLLKARVSYCEGQTIEGDRYLGQALRVGRRNSVRNWQFLSRRELTNILIRALDRGIEVDYVSDLIRLWGIEPEGELWDLETWPWYLKIYTLGRFQLVRNGKTLSFQGKVQERPLELLKAILSLGGSGISSERLVEALWPDSLGDAGRRTLETNLLRLRRLLGTKEVVQLKGGRLSIDPGWCWVDAWAFERACVSAGHAVDEKSCILFNRASALYRGTFLSNDDSQAWTIPMRERLQNKYVRLVDKCSEHHLQSGDHESAIRCCLEALDICPLSETLHMKLILCYEKAGKKNDAVAALERCRKTFLAVYGTEPRGFRRGPDRQFTGK